MHLLMQAVAILAARQGVRPDTRSGICPGEKKIPKESIGNRISPCIVALKHQIACIEKQGYQNFYELEHGHTSAASIGTWVKGGRPKVPD